VVAKEPPLQKKDHFQKKNKADRPGTENPSVQKVRGGEVWAQKSVSEGGRLYRGISTDGRKNAYRKRGWGLEKVLKSQRKGGNLKRKTCR